jgi:hypothetical protein
MHHPASTLEEAVVTGLHHHAQLISIIFTPSSPEVGSISQTTFFVHPKEATPHLLNFHHEARHSGSTLLS